MMSMEVEDTVQVPVTPVVPTALVEAKAPVAAPKVATKAANKAAPKATPKASAPAAPKAVTAKVATVAKTAPKPAAKPAATTVAKPIAKPSAKPAAKTVAKPAAKAAAKPVKKAEPKKSDSKPQKVKMIRDSFTFPEADHSQLAALKKRVVALGQDVKKGELVRAGIALLTGMDDKALLATVATVDRLKTGRPKK